MSAALPAVVTAVRTVAPPPVVFMHVSIRTVQGRTLGDETFRLVAFQGQESISEPFEFELELHGNTSPPHGAKFSFADIVGQPVVVGIHTPSLDSQGRQPTREESNQWFQDGLQGTDESGRLAFYNGIAASFSMEQPGVYRLTMRPAMWRMTLTNAYCVHAQMSVRDAIEALMRRHRLDFSVDALMGTDNIAVTRVQDWLQAGESDFEFLKRLMSKAHVYFFFITTAQTHRIIFANRPAYPVAMPSGKPLRYCSTGAEDLGLFQNDVVTDYRVQQSMTSSSVSAVFTREEAAWETDPLPGFHNYRTQTRSQTGDLPFNQCMVYEYGCSSSEVEHFAINTQDSMDTASFEFSATGYSPFVRAGHQFSLTEFPRADQRPSSVDPALEGMTLVATQVEHQASLDGTYTCKFRSAPARGLVTPFSIQDTQQGTVLAKVVAASGSSAQPPGTWRYYQKNAFDPETRAVTDSDSTEKSLKMQGACVQFATDPDGAPPVWVKLAAHMQTLPEVGTMVLVTRAQNQSELPEIQQIVEANGTKVVKPSGWTANTNVGSNWSTAYGDSLSVRFGATSQANLDTAVSTVTGQYQSGGTFRECSYAQGATYSYATSETGKDGLLNKSDSFGSTDTTHTGASSRSVTEFDSTYSESTVTGTATTRNHFLKVDEMTTMGDSSRMTAAVGTSDITVAAATSNISTTALNVSMAFHGVSRQLEVTGSGYNITLAVEQFVMQSPQMVVNIPASLAIFM